jgi:hypothetical protein
MRFQQELIAGILATVIGGLILAMLTGSGRGSRFLRFVLIMGVLVAIGALVLAQMRGSGRRWRGDVPVPVISAHTRVHADSFAAGLVAARDGKPAPPRLAGA